MPKRETIPWATKRYIETALLNMPDRLIEHLDQQAYSVVKEALERFVATLNDGVCEGEWCEREVSEFDWCDSCRTSAFWAPERE